MVHTTGTEDTIQNFETFEISPPSHEWVQHNEYPSVGRFKRKRHVWKAKRVGR